MSLVCCSATGTIYDVDSFVRSQEESEVGSEARGLDYLSGVIQR